MFGTLVRKEIAETVLDLRFVLATLLCVVLIPLGTYVSREDYEQRLAAYRNEHEMYRQRHGRPVGPVTGQEETQGFRPPSMLSIFASGLDSYLPDEVITSHTGLYRTVKVPGAGNVQSLLFGKADLLFNVTFIVSLAALIFTFNAISGEREWGTLPLMIANSLPRSRILLSKVAGRYIALLVPFVISLLIGLLILDASPEVSIGSRRVGPAFLVILLATGLFLLGMICLGVCISTFTRRPMGSIVVLFFVWAMFLVGVPKVVPMLAEIFYPVESGGIVDLTKRRVRDNIEREFGQVEKETIDSKRDAEVDSVTKATEAMGREIATRVANSGREPTREDFKEMNRMWNDRVREIDARYAPARDRLARECQMRIAEAFKRIEEDYRNRRRVQFALAQNLARFSPVSSYAYIVSGLCGTGVTAPDNFVRNAQRFQDQVEQVFYEKTPWGFGRHLGFAKGFDPWNPPAFPDMAYHYPSLAEALRVHWSDLLLLGLFDVLFFALAFMRFNKYDVR